MRKSLYPRLAEIEAISKPSKEERAEAKELRKLAKADQLLVALSAVQRDFTRKRQAHLRATSGLWWPTLDAQIESLRQAQKALDEPHQRRWDGGGKIVTRVMASPTRQVQIDPLPEGQWATRSGRRHAFTKCRIRIGSVGRDPLWCELPIVQHRPLPPGATITAAAIVVRTMGRHRPSEVVRMRRSGLAPLPQVGVRYEVHLTLNIPEQAATAAELANPTRGRCAVAIGWPFERSDEPVVATVVAGDVVEELRVPSEVMRRLGRREAIKSLWDGMINDLRDLLIQDVGDGHIAEHEPNDVALKDTRDVGRLMRLAQQLLVHLPESGPGSAEDLWRRWRGRGKKRRKDLWCTLGMAAEWSGLRGLAAHAWWVTLVQRQIDHRRDQERCSMRRAIALRDETYKVFAAQLARRFDTLVLEDVDFRKYSRRYGSEQCTRSVRVQCAPSYMRDFLRKKFFGRLVEVKMEDDPEATEERARALLEAAHGVQPEGVKEAGSAWARRRSRKNLAENTGDQAE